MSNELISRGSVLSIIAELDKRDAEIEQLRKDFTDLLRLAANDASKYQAEIERLRELLREFLDMLRLIREGKPTPLNFIEKRVREALGE